MRSFFKGSSVLASFVVVAACASTSPEPVATVDCTGPDANSLAAGIAQVKERLGEPGCMSRYDRYYEDLLAIGESDPGSQNKKVMRDFIAWSHEQGLIGRQKGKEMYTRYFHPNFVSLPDGFSACSSMCPARTAIERDMKTELSQKYRGAVGILGDKDAYRKIDMQYNGLLLLMDATCQACADGNRS
ncbi:MAG: hypothetical protein AAGI88_19265 [Pseudomonadota bacterium]